MSNSTLFLTSIFLFFFINHSFSQASFEKGYFISNEGERIDCYINNVGWLHSPDSFKYKLTLESEVETGTIEDTQEFSVSGVKFIKRNVNIDLTSDLADELTYEKEPELTSLTVFLNVIIESEVSLYSYKRGNLNRLLIEKQGSVEQLMSKSYLITPKEMGVNDRYKGQLFNLLMCECLDLTDFKGVRFNRGAVAGIIIAYNDCLGLEYSYFRKSEMKIKMGLSPRVGIAHTSLSFEREINSNYNTEWNSVNLIIGLEVEALLSINRDAWAFVINPSYRSRISENQGIENDQMSQVNLIYESMEVPFGIRRYFYLENGSKINVDALVVLDIPFNSGMEIDFFGNIEFSRSTGLGLGVGYSFSKNFKLDVRYDGLRNLTNQYAGGWSSGFNAIQLALSYRL